MTVDIQILKSPGSLTKTLCIPGVRLGYVCAAQRRAAFAAMLTSLGAEVWSSMSNFLRQGRS